MNLEGRMNPGNRWKRTLLAGAALALAVSACGQADDPEEDRAPAGEEAPKAEGSPGGGGAEGGTEAGDEVHVLNMYGDEEGFDDQRPTDYVANEFTTFSDMEWDQWDGTRALGEGEVLGTWCMDQGCQDDPYDVEIELGDPVEANGTRYFSTYTVTEYDDDMPQEQRDALEQADGGQLNTPAAE
ncbi:hypothetical protein [Nocardiopsis ganjiahuensis]|uniref:hypothetical protein n=1 Tax=Nocardiopsis ganjiahuensis TaxID=239984 RepID=UPI00034A71BA|nr:hypothetical protein [Nocardiopsis ganjiahuensis]